MSRRTNLNTIRRGFNWDSYWTTFNPYYTQVMWFDIKITSFLQGMFYVLRLPSSSYIIRRFLSSFVIIETDVWLFTKLSFTYFLPNPSYFSYAVYKVRNLLFTQHTKQKKLEYASRNKQFSASSIVYHLMDRRRIMHRSKPKMRTDNLFDFDANTTQKRDVSKFGFENWEFVYSNKWLKRRYIKQSSMANTSSMLIWKQKKIIGKWQRVVANTIGKNSYRYLFFSRYLYRSYFARYFNRKIGRFVKWAAKHRSTTTLPSFNTVLDTLEQYFYLFKRLCSFARFSYISRNSLNLNLVFRLLLFYNRNALRSLLFSRLSVTNSIELKPWSHVTIPSWRLKNEYRNRVGKQLVTTL